MSFPFPFFGARPSDWTGDVHRYRLVFSATPSGSETARIAASLEETLARNPDISMGEWSWNGRHARFVLEPPTSLEMDAFFIEVELLMRSIHRQCRLAEAIHETARGGSSEWDDWTSDRRTHPTGAPSGEWAIDGTFESERKRRRPLALAGAAAREQAKQEASHALQQAKEASKTLTLEACPQAPRPAPPVPPPALKALFDAAGPPTFYVMAADRWLGILDKGVLYVDKAGKVKKRATKTKGKEALMSEDGSVALVSDFRCYRVDLPDAKVSEVVFRPPSALIGTDRVVCVDGVYKTVQLWTMDGRELHSVQCGASRGWGLGTTIAVSASDDSGPHVRFELQFYRVQGDRLELAGSIPGAYATAMWVHDGRVYLLDASGNTSEVKGLDEIR